MKKKKKRKKKPLITKLKKQNIVRYVCSNCGAKEDIPEDVLEYFDEVNPTQLLCGPHEFTCEKCDIGIMSPENKQEIIVKGFGLYEGLGE